MNIRRVGLVAALIAMVVSGAAVASPAQAAVGNDKKLAVAASGFQKIVNDWSGKCVEVPGASLADGAVLQQWDCGGSGETHRRWGPISLGGNFVQYMNQNSGKCMHLIWGTLTVIQKTCDIRDLQQAWYWRTGPFGEHALTAHPAAGFACLALRPLSKKNGNNVGIEECATVEAMLWHPA